MQCRFIVFVCMVTFFDTVICSTNICSIKKTVLSNGLVVHHSKELDTQELSAPVTHASLFYSQFPEPRINPTQLDRIVKVLNHQRFSLCQDPSKNSLLHGRIAEIKAQDKAALQLDRYCRRDSLKGVFSHPKLGMRKRAVSTEKSPSGIATSLSSLSVYNQPSQQKKAALKRL